MNWYATHYVDMKAWHYLDTVHGVLLVHTRYGSRRYTYRSGRYSMNALNRSTVVSFSMFKFHSLISVFN